MKLPLSFLNFNGDRFAHFHTQGHTGSRLKTSSYYQCCTSGKFRDLLCYMSSFFGVLGLTGVSLGLSLSLDCMSKLSLSFDIAKGKDLVDRKERPTVNPFQSLWFSYYSSFPVTLMEAQRPRNSFEVTSRETRKGCKAREGTSGYNL